MSEARFPFFQGDHRYTATDAERTLASLGPLWEHHRHRAELSPDVVATGMDLARTASAIAGLPRPDGDVAVALHDAGMHLARRFTTVSAEDLARVLEATWALFSRTRPLTVTHEGVITSLHAGRGLPKPAVTAAQVTFAGLTGDVQRARRHHGRPQQALCLWSTDAIDTLRAEGHPIAAGHAGENLTIGGVPRDAIRPGARLVIGDVEAFVSSYAIPCKNNAPWFTDGDFMRMHHERGDESRTYAMVTSEGTVRVGDNVVVTSDR